MSAPTSSMVSAIARIPCQPGGREEHAAAPELHVCRPVRAKGHDVEG